MVGRGRDRSAIEAIFGPEGEAARRIRLAILMLAGIIVVGTTGYVALGWGFLDALYMTVITVGTIGFEEVRDLNESVAGRLWTIVLIISGVAVLGYATTSLVALAVEGTVRDYFRSRRMRTEISRLHGHHILCGYSRVGRQVAEEFALQDVPFVVVEHDPRTVEECLVKGYPAVFGEASDDGVLREAGILRAGGLVAAVGSDADNVFVVLSARKLNPNLHIVARASSDESAAKLEIAGADRTIGELKIGEKTGAIVLAFRTAEGKFDTTPSADDHLHAGDTLIVLGSRGQIKRLEQLIRGEEVSE